MANLSDRGNGVAGNSAAETSGKSTGVEKSQFFKEKYHFYYTPRSLNTGGRETAEGFHPP